MANHVSFTFDDHIEGSEYTLTQDFDDIMGKGCGLMLHGNRKDADVVFHISTKDSLDMAWWILREYGARK